LLKVKDQGKHPASTKAESFLLLVVPSRMLETAVVRLEPTRGLSCKRHVGSVVGRCVEGSQRLLRHPRVPSETLGTDRQMGIGISVGWVAGYPPYSNLHRPYSAANTPSLTKKPRYKMDCAFAIFNSLKSP